MKPGPGGSPAQAPVTRGEGWGLVLISAAALLLRGWQIGAKGLWYDEAVTSFFARAPLAEMVAFHWQSPFEHAPTWMVLEHFWTALFGQGEAALRWPSALAGAALPWATWLLVRYTWPEARIARLVAAVLVALSPMLILFSQEARMYALASLLAVLSFAWLVRFLETGRPAPLVGLVLANWGMSALQYYYGLVFVAEGLAALSVARWRPRRALAVLGALVVSAVPALLWVALSPNFRSTAGSVLSRSVPAISAGAAYFARVWRDLTFGAAQFQPERAVAGYVLLPLALLGLVMLFLWPRGKPAREAAVQKVAVPVLFISSLLVPPLLTGAMTAQGYTRWFLYAVPLICVLMALAIEAMWRWRAWAGLLGLVLALGVFAYGDRYYFCCYAKSQYRDAAAEVAAGARPGDALVLEGPRQQLLAKYYMPSLPLYTVPEVELPEFWPVNAPPVVPEQEDGRLRDILAAHEHAWLVLAGEDEVDKGEFVRRYLAAVSYELSCRLYVAVELCRYIAPERIAPEQVTPLAVQFGGVLGLHDASSALYRDTAGTFLATQFDWRLDAASPTDHVVTLRLVDSSGKMVAQLDRRPIGDLLPTPTWSQGDEKPGYFVLKLPELAPGDYTLRAGVYDAATLQLLPVAPEGLADQGMVEAACVRSAPGKVEIVPCAGDGS